MGFPSGFMDLCDEILHHLFGLRIAFDFLCYLFHIMHHSGIMAAAKQFPDFRKRMVRQGAYQVHGKLAGHRDVAAAPLSNNIVIGDVKLIAYDLYDICLLYTSKPDFSALWPPYTINTFFGA